MQILIYTSAVIGFLLITFIIIEKPYFLVGILVFMMIYIFNLNIPGPLDARGLLLLIVFVRLFIFDKYNLELTTQNLFRNKYFYFITIFIIINAVITYLYSTSGLKEPLKLLLLNLISFMMGYFILHNSEGRKAFTFGIVSAGFISVIDLVMHYWQFGGISGELTLYRTLDLISTGTDLRINHNFPGLLSGTAFIYVYLFQNKMKWTRWFTIPLMIILGTGVFLSTSRSTILSIIIVMFIINLSSNSFKVNLKRIMITATMFIVVYSSFYFVYNIFLKTASSKDNLADVIYYRLYDEPAQMFGGGHKKFDKYSGKIDEGGLVFRMDKAKHDIGKFTNRGFVDQVFGLGKGGYKKIGQRIYLYEENYSYVLAPHNGYVMILIEHGFLGLILFFIFAFGLSIKSLKINKSTNMDLPIVYIFIALAIYSIGQNSELTSTLSYLMLGGMIANVENPNDDENEEESTD